MVTWPWNWGRARRFDRGALVREGRDAYGRGLPLDENPYSDGEATAWSSRHATWASGWRAAEWDAERAAYAATRALWRGGRR